MIHGSSFLNLYISVVPPNLNPSPHMFLFEVNKLRAIVYKNARFSKNDTNYNKMHTCKFIFINAYSFFSHQKVKKSNFLRIFNGSSFTGLNN